MKKILIFLIYLLVFLSGIFAEKNYDILEIATIPFGKGDGQLGYNDKDFIPGAGYPMPLFFSITESDNIYIYDWANNRICVFDININFIKNIKFKDYIGYIYSMKIDEFENIYLLSNGLEKISNKGDKIYSIKSSSLSPFIGSNKEFYPQKGYVFFYDDEYKLGCFDLKGKKITDNDLVKIKNEVRQVPKAVNDIELDKVIEKYNKRSERLFSKNNLIINDSAKFIDYLSFVKNNIIIKNKINDVKYNKKDLIKTMRSMIGIDNIGNVYWDNRKEIIVFSKFGELIERLKYNHEIYGNPVITQNGDIYFWTFKPEGVGFGKITCQW